MLLKVLAPGAKMIFVGLKKIRAGGRGRLLNRFTHDGNLPNP
jgi:hypothetical protein